MRVIFAALAAALLAIVLVVMLISVAPAASGTLSSSNSPRFGITPFWWDVGTCETGHIGEPGDGAPRFDWGARRRHLEGSRFEGFVGFAASTWRLWAGELGLLGRYPHAYEAPPLVQQRVARYGLSVGGYWGCLS